MRKDHVAKHVSGNTSSENPVRDLENDPYTTGQYGKASSCSQPPHYPFFLYFFIFFFLNLFIYYLN